MTQRCSVATASNSSAPLHFSINVTVPCSLHPDRTITNLSVPVEGCERLPGLPGVRKVGPDSLTRRCSDQGCNFGTRAGLNSAAIPALRALDTADTGSPFAKKPGVRNIRRKVRPDIATFAGSRQSDLDRSVNFYRDVSECHVALHESEAALLLTPGGFQIYFRAHETPDTRHRRCGRRADHLVRRQRSRTATDRTTPAHALSQYLHQHPERDHSRRRRRPR